MKKMMLVATIFVIAAAMNPPVGFAQSSGSFNYAKLPMKCVLNATTGALPKEPKE